MLARIPADVSKRLLILTCAAALISGACSNPPEAQVDFGEGKEFVPFVADHLDDAGLGNAVALDKDGVPYVSYFIFPEVLAEGAIPIPRPIGAPFITTGGDDPKDAAAVGIASVSADGVWTRGAAAQPIDSPAGISVPYAPDTVDGLVGATAENTNGTDIAIDGDGGKHVVWAGRDGIWYATGTTTFTGSATAIEEWTPPLAHAGPLGRPSITVDEGGAPLVAYAIDSPGGQDIRVATTDGTDWTTETAASIEGCLGCRDSGPAPIAVDAAGPLVIYIDGVERAVMAARQTGDTWTTETVQAGVSASGLSVAVDADGVTWVSYYTGDGVQLATSSGAGWTSATIADAKPGNGTGNLAETTAVAVDDEGTVYAAWYDSGDQAVHLASSPDGATFEPIATNGTAGGAYPSLAVAPDGTRVFLAWYDVATQNILLGILGEVTDILVANPSPTPEVAPPTSAPPAAECPRAGLELVAPAGAAATGFGQTTLSAPADEDFIICFDNQDTGVQHNVEVLTQAPPDGESIAAGGIIVGPAQENLDVPAQPEGAYFYQCDVHPTTMTGTLDVA